LIIIFLLLLFATLWTVNKDEYKTLNVKTFFSKKKTFSCLGRLYLRDSVFRAHL